MLRLQQTKPTTRTRPSCSRTAVLVPLTVCMSEVRLQVPPDALTASGKRATAAAPVSASTEQNPNCLRIFVPLSARFRSVDRPYRRFCKALLLQLLQLLAHHGSGQWKVFTVSHHFRLPLLAQHVSQELFHIGVHRRSWFDRGVEIRLLIQRISAVL